MQLQLVLLRHESEEVTVSLQLSAAMTCRVAPGGARCC